MCRAIQILSLYIGTFARLFFFLSVFMNATCSSNYHLYTNKINLYYNTKLHPETILYDIVWSGQATNQVYKIK